MTGTSLDGVDLCLAKFDQNGYDILDFECVQLANSFKNKLASAHLLTLEQFVVLENEYSLFIANEIRRFNEKTGYQAQFAGVHGQTILHDPIKGLTTQMLNGGIISSQTKLTTVCDFRRADVALGGQGAPLVPIGDRALFGDYAACINLGGFANISMNKVDKRVAYDICPVNFVLNQFAKKLGKEFDAEGKLAKSGEFVKPIYKNLNSLPYYQKSIPKSLGREWVEKSVMPLMTDLNPEDGLRTYSEHAAYQIASAIPSDGKVLLTGGGTYNEFLISLIKKNLGVGRIVIPDNILIEAKEALIFAYMAKLRLDGMPNVLSSVTGASKNSCSGAVYIP